MFDIWSKKNNLAEDIYKKENYQINDNLNGGGYCVIYCSSNNIWYPNEQEVFEDCFVKNNRFEWTRIHSKLASKEIYIRDIYKSWYVTGINETINSLDCLIEFLREKTLGYKVITIGSSSGGYLASILSVYLKAEYAIAFSPQFELKNEWAMGVNTFLELHAAEEKYAKYYDLKPIIDTGETPIFYVVPKKNKMDAYQYSHIKNCKNVYPIIFNSYHHGTVMYKCNLEKFISLEYADIFNIYLKYKDRIVSPFKFSIKLSGVNKTVANCFIEVQKQISKRLL